MERPVSLTYAIVFVTDMGRSVAFYRDVVGLRLKFESPSWSEFMTGGATLALHVGEGAPPEASAPVERAPGGCRPGFGVPDLDAFHRRMVEARVPCVQEPTLLFGARVAQYVDPDGLAFSVGETRA